LNSPHAPRSDDNDEGHSTHPQSHGPPPPPKESAAAVAAAAASSIEESRKSSGKLCRDGANGCTTHVEQARAKRKTDIEPGIRLQMDNSGIHAELLADLRDFRKEVLGGLSYFE
jgi:hypothetical protein